MVEVDVKCDKTNSVDPHGSSQIQRRVEPVRFKRRPTMRNRQKLRVGQRGEAPLVPPLHPLGSPPFVLKDE